jgi:hypothetical protein
MLIMLMVKMVGARKRKEPRKEMGIPRLTQKASRMSRNRARKKKTRPSPI